MSTRPAISKSGEITQRRTRRAVAAAFVAMLLPAVVLALFHWDLPSLGSFHDDGMYLVTAKAIADGKGYRIASLPDERWQTKYPPAFPLALAAVWRLFPRFPANAGGFLIAVWLALPTLAFLQSRMLAKLEFPLASQVLACLCILAYQDTLLLSVTLLSDLWFCCAVLLAILLAGRASESEAHWKYAAAAGVAAAIACLTKSAGIVLLASVPGVMLLRCRWRNALVFCAISGPALAIWSGWSLTHCHPITDYNDAFYSSYLQEFMQKGTPGNLIPQFMSGVGALLQRLGAILIPEFLSGVVFDWLRCIGAILGLAGIMRLCRSGKAWPYAAFAALYALEMCMWPSRLAPRYVLPLVPLWIAGLLSLPQYYRSVKGNPRFSGNAPLWGALAAGILAFFCVIQCLQGIYAATVARSKRQALEPAYAWIAHRAEPTASVVAFRDPLLYLYTERHAEVLASSANENALSRVLGIAEFARLRGHRYVLVGPWDPEFYPYPGRDVLSAALGSDRGCRRVYSAQGVDIYELAAQRNASPK